MSYEIINEKKIFSKKLASYLRQQGFIIVRIEPNLKIQDFQVYVFVDSKYLDEAIGDYLKNQE